MDTPNNTVNILGVNFQVQHYGMERADHTWDTGVSVFSPNEERADHYKANLIIGAVMNEIKPFLDQLDDSKRAQQELTAFYSGPANVVEKINIQKHVQTEGEIDKLVATVTSKLEALSKDQDFTGPLQAAVDAYKAGDAAFPAFSLPNATASVRDSQAGGVTVNELKVAGDEHKR